MGIYKNAIKFSLILIYFILNNKFDKHYIKLIYSDYIKLKLIKN